jgi:putrescine transport system ATP-binding protein
MTLARSRPAQGRPLEPWQDPAARPFVRIAGVTRKYGDIYAVDNVSLDIYRGEFFALLGPSGCGKTTLLRMLAGFDRPTSGRIEIDGQDMSAVPPWRRPVNMMFQSYALFPHMTVGQNVAFGLKQDRVPKDELKRRVEEALALVRLDAFAGRRPDQLSGGQRQRVALARAIAKRPKLVLLDEPLAALDKKLRETTQFELVSIQEKLGITFVIVTHDQEEAMTVSTRMAIMRDGQVAQMGPPAEIYEYPDSRFVADFVGDVNLLEARVVEAGSSGMRLASPAAACEIVTDRAVPAVAGETMWVAIRPEKFELATSPPADIAVNCMAGRVADIAYLGDVSIYHVRLASGATIRATAANRQRLIERPVTWEDEVWLLWRPDAAIVLKS